ncbi:SDR family oxidoreductase [Allosaccharopolyspora coralli]|uniref:SDR family oxidoreductase n=1 Tax=Allosaccharopolyspora coralli TaxID=2665642 RepID=A0A5Q3QC82_9PSEU|nr:SDR family oxidoreductase [Allosaccharopolyspora coralli]QGK69075.1 SDR family oxidoreductase [Allosaccharopolyspora coralli]
MGLILVTGSASGIGAATCQSLRAEGHQPIGLDLRDADVEADLSMPEGRQLAVDGVLRRCSGTLDGLVLCAGLGPHVDVPERIVSVNYFGTTALLDGLFPALCNGVRPAAVVVSSLASTMVSWEDNPFATAVDADDEEAASTVVGELGDLKGHLAYAGAKNALTVAVRRRVAEWGAAGVRLNTVAPGSVGTPLLEAGLRDERYGDAIRDLVAPIPRWAAASEVAAGITFLLGPNAAYVHGAQIPIDGGVDALLRPTRF